MSDSGTLPSTGACEEHAVSAAHRTVAITQALPNPLRARTVVGRPARRTSQSRRNRSPRRARAQPVLQLIEKSALSGQYLSSRLVQREPFAAIDLGKLL